MRIRSRLRVLAAGAVAVAAAAIPAAVSARSTAHPDWRHGDHIQHVLLISVDGLHASDLQWYAQTHPGSVLARLVSAGADYTDALTPVPSDSFPGMVAQVTGGDPRSTGVYYDDEYDHDLLPAGTTDCATATPGAAVNFDESLDLNSSSLDAGQGLAGLPGSILQLTGTPKSLIDPTMLPVDPQTCQPVYPNQYLEVNTIFEVAHQHGLLTAWSDKHPAYQILDGPSGTGITDEFTPEINSDATGYPAGGDWTSDNAATQQYDSYKVQAVINEIDGYNHQRTQLAGVPAIFGMNFQTVSTAEKLPTSDGLTGGYLPGTDTPGPLLSRALDFVNASLQRMADALSAQGLLGSTAVILSAKHGQSPIDPNALTRIDDGPIVAGVNAAWAKLHPTAPPLVAADTDDDAIMWWLSDRSQAAAHFAAGYLMSHAATGNTVSGGSRTLASSGLQKVYAGRAAASYFGVPESDPRHPDLWGIVQHGVVYTGGTGKIAEHGGADADDRNVALVAWAPGVVRSGVYRQPLETTEIAPTILQLLGLNPWELQAVREQHTPTLPGVGWGW